MDFATGEKGGDVVSLIAAIKGCSQLNAAKILAERLGFSTQPTSSNRQNARIWTPIMPVPADAPPPPKSHPKRGTPNNTWAYKSSNGEVLFLVYRFDLSSKGKNGKQDKEFRPLSYCTDGVFREWQWQVPKSPCPLYGLDRLGDASHIIIVEGEKTADAAQRLFGGTLPVLAYQGGSCSVNKNDFGPLSGRHVAILPDADKPGIKGALDLITCLREIGAAEVKVVEPPDGVAEGWDLADAADEGWSVEQARIFLRKAIPYQEYIAKHVISVSIGQAATNKEWPEPLPLTVKTKAENYPLDALPIGIASAISELQRFVQAPIPLVASSCLGALSTAVQQLVDVKRDDGLTGPVSLFIVTVAESGERKTTTDNKTTEEIRAYQREAAELAKPLQVQYRGLCFELCAKAVGGIFRKVVMV